MDSKQAKVLKIIEFLSENEYILNSHITEVYSKDYFSTIPPDWFESLLSYSYLEYLSILHHTDTVPPT